MTQAERFVEAARSYVGTRWVHQGRLPGVGLDCGGLAICAAAAAGKPLEDVEGYDRPLSGHALVRAVVKNADRVRGPLQPGDVLLMARGDSPDHIAIFSGDGQIIHTWASIKRVVEHQYSSTWQDCLRGVYRLRWSE